MAECPPFVTDRKWCGADAAWIASTAMRTLPSVPFLNPDRAGQSRRQLAMHLALGRARADRAPGDEVGDVLRRDHVEELGAGGQPEVVDVEQDSPREPQAFVDAEAVVEPADR